MWRKAYSLVAVAVLISVPLDVAGQGCASGRIRRDIKSLGSDVFRFFEAVRELQNATPRPNTYDGFTKKHLDAAGPAHHNAKFLPWHRALLLEFEQALQRTSSGAGMMVPYWNWSADSQNPAGSIIFNRDWFGGDGRGDCVTDGKFSDWMTHYPNEGCLTRSFNSNGAISSFVPPEDIERLVGLSDYNDFRVQLEDVPHAQVHIRIGADFAGMASPNDPLFWVHHSNVDRIWASWQVADRARRMHAYNGLNSNGNDANLNDNLDLLGRTAGSVMDFEQLCYTYDTFIQPRFARRSNKGSSNNAGEGEGEGEGEGIKTKMVTLSEEEERNALPSADDRAELFQLRDILPAPEEYIRMGNGNVTEFRESEQKCREFIRKVNKLDGYVSPAALANRKDLLQNIAEKQSTFTATRGNKRCILQTPDGPPSANIIDSLVKKASLSLSINLSLGGSNGNNNLNALLPLIGKEGVERMKKQQSK